MSMITEQVERMRRLADEMEKSTFVHEATHFIAIKALREAADTIEQLAAKVRAENNGGWIPITYRPMTEEEKKDYAERTIFEIEDLEKMLDCPLPEDGETVLITDRLGNVCTDTFCEDCDSFYFECNVDMEDVKAWMPLPESYKESDVVCTYQESGCGSCKHQTDCPY